MRKALVALGTTLSLFLSGCGPHFYKPGIGPNQPAEITVSAYTQDGCFEELQEEARELKVEVKLKDVQADLGWQIFVFPLYKGYRCTGVVVQPK